MSKQLSLMEEPQDKAQFFVPDFSHFYARYGLAATLVQSRLRVEDLTEENLVEALLHIIISAKDNFRLEPDVQPIAGSQVVFSTIRAKRLQSLLEDSNEKKGMAVKGRYVLPTCISSDIAVAGLWKSIEEWEKNITERQTNKKRSRTGKSYPIKRSVSPIAGDRNNGKNDAQPPQADFWEAACCLAATVTPLKPASYSRVPGKNPGSGTNTAIMPDLDLEDMRYFIGFFQVMQTTEMDALLTVSYHLNTKKENLKYRRPPFCRGNYPGAPQDGSTFGAIGPLGAIGEWVKKAPHRNAARRVIQSLENRPVYLVSYDNTRVTHFSHHVVQLALRGQLASIIDSFHRKARLWADTEGPRPNRGDKSRQAPYLLLYLSANQFLERFTPESFRDFFAHRAEYPVEFRLALEEYFMKAQGIPQPIIAAASSLGQHLNYLAYRVAKDEVGSTNPSNEEDKKEADEAIRKEKSKYLVELETGIMSARSATELFANVSQRAGRILNFDFPAEAKPFMDWSMADANLLTQTKHLLIAYMRLRSQFQAREDGDREPKGTPDTDSDDAFTSDDEAGNN